MLRNTWQGVHITYIYKIPLCVERGLFTPKISRDKEKGSAERVYERVLGNIQLIGGQSTISFFVDNNILSIFSSLTSPAMFSGARHESDREAF